MINVQQTNQSCMLVPRSIYLMLMFCVYGASAVGQNAGFKCEPMIKRRPVIECIEDGYRFLLQTDTIRKTEIPFVSGIVAETTGQKVSGFSLYFVGLCINADAASTDVSGNKFRPVDLEWMKRMQEGNNLIINCAGITNTAGQQVVLATREYYISN